MSAAIDLCYARFAREEGVRRFAYNDATGKRVTCQPGGNLTIAEGINLEVGMDYNEIEWITKYRLGNVEVSLGAYDWYKWTDQVRQSVLLDLAFNMGVAGLLHFPRMLAAVQAKDWSTAHDELLASRAATEEPARIGALAVLLLNGGANAG